MAAADHVGGPFFNRVSLAGQSGSTCSLACGGVLVGFARGHVNAPQKTASARGFSEPRPNFIAPRS
jgi:hypothetical protein